MDMDCKEKGHSTLIVGASCRLPKSNNMEEFWENLINGRDMIDKTRFPEGLYDIPPRAGIMPNIDKFDADYFGYSFEDAHDINVMLRHLLEVTHECVVDSGIAERPLKEQVTGFYCGCFLQDCDPIETSRSTPTRHCTTVPQLAGHVMNKFGWTGPSVTVDTACSASISALQMAVTDLTIGRCKFAVVTGVNLILNPTNLQQMKLLGMLSPEGQSRVFDRDANGYVRAEGVVAILLTRNEPENCGRVYGTVVDVMTNCDGYTPDGITFPNGAVQRQLLRNIYKKNQVSTADIAYMEMHSTGTKAGDPVEVGSITDVLCADRSTPLLIGSVKSNMGHSEATAGLASLIKCLLVARHKVIPPQLNYNNPNPRIPAVKEKKVIIVDKPTPLPDGYICVNSFGFGGANGHLIFKPYHSPLKPSSQKFTLIKHTARSEEEAASISSFLSEADVRCNANISKFVSMSALSHDQKRPIRGYTISGTAVKENIDKVKMLTQDRGRLKILLDLEDFVWDKTHISPLLMEIPQFRKSIDLSQKILSENKDSKISISELIKQEEHIYPITQHNLCLAVATQIGIVDCLQEAGLKIDHVAGSGLSSIVAAYVDGGLTQKQCMGIAAVIGRALEKHYPYKDDKHKIYKVHLQPETLELLGDHTQVLSCTEEGGVIRVDTPHLEETLNSIHDKGGFYQELVGMLPLYSHCVPGLNNHVKKELRSILIHPLLSSSKFLTEDIENKGRTTSRPVLFDAEYFSQLLCNFHKHPVTHSVDMVSLKLNLGNVHVTQPLEEAGPPVIYCTTHPVSVLSMFGDIHLLGETFDVRPLYEVSSTLDIKMPSISNLVRWDHSTSWYVPQWHEYCTAVNNVGKNPTYIIKTAESDSINTALSVLLYHSWMAVVKKEQISKQMDDTGIELCNLTIPGGVNMTCDTLSHAEIQVQIHQKSFTAQKDGMVLMSGNYRIHKDSLQFPRIPGYDYDMNKNIEPSIGKDDEDTLSKSEIMWEDSWLEFMNTVLEFALQHLKGPLTRVIFNPTEHRKEVKKCANVPTVVEYYTGLCKAGSSIMIQTLVTKTTHLTSDHQKTIDISGSENTLISMIKAYTINKHQADNQDKVLLYQGEHSDTGVKVIGVVLVTANETQCREFPVSESWTADDMNQLIPYTIAHYIVCTVAKAGCNKRFLICPPIDTVAVYIMAIADQLGNAVFASSYDVEVRQMLDEIFPFARVLPGSRLVQNVKCLTQSEGCDVCIKFSSGVKLKNKKKTKEAFCSDVLWCLEEMRKGSVSLEGNDDDCQGDNDEIDGNLQSNREENEVHCSFSKNEMSDVYKNDEIDGNLQSNREENEVNCSFSKNEMSDVCKNDADPSINSDDVPDCQEDNDEIDGNLQSNREENEVNCSFSKNEMSDVYKNDEIDGNLQSNREDNEVNCSFSKNEMSDVCKNDADPSINSDDVPDCQEDNDEIDGNLQSNREENEVNCSFSKNEMSDVYKNDEIDGNLQSNREENEVNCSFSKNEMSDVCKNDADPSINSDDVPDCQEDNDEIDGNLQSNREENEVNCSFSKNEMSDVYKNDADPSINSDYVPDCQEDNDEIDGNLQSNREENEVNCSFSKNEMSDVYKNDEIDGNLQSNREENEVNCSFSENEMSDVYENYADSSIDSDYVPETSDDSDVEDIEHYGLNMLNANEMDIGKEQHHNDQNTEVIGKPSTNSSKEIHQAQNSTPCSESKEISGDCELTINRKVQEENRIYSGSTGVYIKEHTKSNEKSKIGRVFDRAHACLYCGKLFTNIQIHLEKHQDKPEIKDLKEAKQKARNAKHEEKPSLMREVKRLQNLLRTEGDHKHNLAVMKNNKGELLLARRRKGTFVAHEYGPCPQCLEWIRLRDNYAKHRLNCSSKNRCTESVANVQQFIFEARISPEASEQLKKEVFPSMMKDHISTIAMEDTLVISIGEYHFNSNIANKIRRKNYTSYRMRLAARLLNLLRKELCLPKASFLELIKAEYFDAFIKCSMEACGVTKDEELKHPSTALKLGFDIARLAGAKTCYAIRQRNEELRNEADNFTQLVQREWKIKIKKRASTLLEERQFNKKTELPLPDDIAKLAKYLVDNLNTLKLTEDSATFQRVVVLTEARLLLYNRRRPGELEAIRVSTYRKRSQGVDETDLSLRAELTKMEKKLLESQELLEIRGKCGKKVPVLLPLEVKGAMNYLADPDIREKCGIQKDNPYIFANKRDLSVRAGNALNLIKYEIDLRRPDRIMATNLRKHTATISQVMGLDDQQLKWLQRHMGHTERVHLQHYRATSGLIERIDIAKLMLLQEKNMVARFAGVRLEDISFEDLDDADQEERPGFVDKDGEDEAAVDEDIVQADQGEQRHEDGTVAPLSDLSDFISDGDYEKPQKKKRKSAVKRIPWTDEEVNEINIYFGEFIKGTAKRKCPGMKECLHAIQQSKMKGTILQRRLDEYVDLIGQEGKLIQCAELQQGESFNLKFLQRNGALILPDVTNAFRNLINKSPEDIQSMLYNIQSGSISKLTEEGFPESKGLLYNLEAKFQFQHAILFSCLLSLIEEMCMSESFSEMSEEDCIAMERLQNLVSTKPTDYSLAEISPGGKYKKPFNNQLLNVAQNFTPQSCATTPDIFVVSLKGITISPPSQKKPIKALFKIEKESNRDSLKFTSTPMITVTDTDNKPDELHESYIENVAPSNMLNVKSRSTLPLLRITPGNSIPRRSKTPSQRGVDLLFRVPPPTPRTPAVRSMMTQKQVNPTLIPLNDKQGPKTIFMVHPVTGKLNLLKPLGAALPTQVFGLQRTESTPRDTLANIASYYLNSVEMKEPFGPYHIIGMSFGSIITLEMAMQIQESGREVHDLILLDGGPQYFRSQIKHDHLCTGQSDPMFEALALLVFLQLFGPIENRNLVTKVLVNLPDRAARIQTAVDMTFKMVSISSNPQQTRWMAAKLKLMKAKKPERYGIADAAQEIVRLKRIQAAEDFFAYVSMIHPFVPSERKFKGNIHLLRIKDDLPHIYEPLPTDYGLKDWCTGEVHIRFYNGDHETFMNLPEVRKEILRIFSLD